MKKYCTDNDIFRIPSAEKYYAGIYLKEVAMVF